MLLVAQPHAFLGCFEDFSVALFIPTQRVLGALTLRHLQLHLHDQLLGLRGALLEPFHQTP